MTQTINVAKLTFKVDDDGTLKILSGEAKKAGKAVDDVGHSAHTADRRLKGASQQSSNTSKNFSKMAQGIQGGLVPAYATLAASLFAVGAVFRAFQNAADFQALQASQEAYAASTGVMLGSVSRSLQEATGFQIDLQKAGSSAAIMIAKGFDASQINEVAQASTMAAQALGRNYEDTFNRIVQGTTKAEPELLDELGITLRLETATQKYADAVGKSRDELTTYERSQAVLNETLRQAHENFGAVAGRVPVNAFNKLQTTMSDLTMSFQQAFAPIANFFADVLGSNIGAAVAALGLFASSILSTVLPSTEEMINNIDEWAGKHTAAYDKAKADMAEYSAAQKKASMDVEASRAEGKANLQTSAQRLGKVDSPVLKRAQRGTLAGADVTNLDKALKAAEAQYKKHGKIVSGIFKGKDIQIVRSMRTSFDQMNAKSRTWMQSTKVVVKKVGLAFKVGAAGIKAGWQATMAGMGKATAKFGAFAGKVMGKAGTIGIIIMVFQTIQSMVDNIDKIIIGSMKMIGQLIDGVIFMVDKMLGVIAKIPGPMGKIAEVAKDNLPEAGKFTKQFEDMGKAFVEEKGLDTFAQNRREGKAANDNLNTSLDETKDKLKTIEEILSERERKSAQGIESSYLKTLEEQANTLASSGILSEVSKLQNMSFAKKSEAAGGGALYSQEQIQTQAKSVQELFDGLVKVVPSLGKFKDVTKMSTEELGHFITEFINSGKTLDVTEQALVSATARRAERVKGLASTYFDKELADIMTVQNQYSVLDAAQKLKESEAAELATLLGVDQASIMGMSVGQILEVIKNKSEQIGNQIQAQRQLSLDVLQTQQMTAGIGSRKDEFAKQIKQRQQLSKFTDQQVASELKIKELLDQHALLDGKKQEDNRILIDQERIRLQIIKDQTAEYKRSITIAGQLQDTFADGLDNMFLKIIQGTESAKDALKQLAIVVIQEMQRIAAAKLAAGLIEAMAGAFPGFGKGTTDVKTGSEGPSIDALNKAFNMNTGSGIPGLKTDARYGGILGKKGGYSLGGIADGPQGGYSATLHGREAVVPLPNGDKIPVEMKGGHGPINSNINITINNEGESEMTTQESSALGEAIQSAVTKEIANQQRPGGLLSPF